MSEAKTDNNDKKRDQFDSFFALAVFVGLLVLVVFGSALGWISIEGTPQRTPIGTDTEEVNQEVEKTLGPGKIRKQ